MRIMWMVFWTKNNIFPIKQNMKSRIKLSERKSRWQNRKKTALERQKNPMRTG